MDKPAMLDRTNVAVVIPALNEVLRIREVVAGALRECDHVIVIDDGSDDGTSDRIADLPVTLLRHPQRMGKGASLRDGFREAERLGMAAVTTIDGDGQHAASDIPRLIAAANRHPGCVIIGARLRKRASQPLYRRIGNDFGDWGIAWGCGFRVRDTQSGFVFEAQLLISATRHAGARVVGVPIETRYQAADAPQEFRKSHFRLFRDLYAITSHVVAQVWRYGHVIREYRRARANPPVIDDPSGEFTSAHRE
jgi:glycosyltransferase involved in cell wall biosynthesis